jgi:hypothetical protein
MASNRFSGVIGFATQTEQSPGVWEDTIVEHQYYGSVLRASRRLEQGQGVNDDIVVENSISVVADPFANEHIFAMRYVKWAGALWTVTTVEVQSPRLILRLGGVYNGPTPAPIGP